ncbi:SDR family NAD(P)-dependent oxidoreductase [Sphingomonas sp.]|uniref:SDR family NAD(P)-dependent oxidoreductase n=1 Tax=Sphingomonas sp. TaxID=28214 RepID=UPI003AFFAF1E
MYRTKGKVALVTGAGSLSGLGYATARTLLREGARCVITDVNESGIAASGDALGVAGGEVLALRHDVTSEADWASVLEATIARFGRLDILVNNAGVAILRPMDAMTVADWHRQIDINLTSVYLGCEVALRQMRVQGDGGSIVNVSSVAGLVGIAGASAYAASKGGVRLFTKSVALEYARENIRVNSVHPGAILTDMQKVSLAANPEQYDLTQAAIPMGRMGEPDDIAAMVLFLASDEARYITGAEFTVDGGLTAQ